MAENPSRACTRSAIYDRIGFAAVGRTTNSSDFGSPASRFADLTGFLRPLGRDQPGFGQCHAQTFARLSEAPKPHEIELVVAEVGQHADEDQLTD